jgi:hypothetical protein
MTLTFLERRWAEAALSAIFPGSPELGFSGIASMNVASHLAHVMARLPWQSAAGIRLAIWVVALAPLFVVGRFTVLARLSPRDRERVLERLGASRHFAVRSLVVLLKAIGALLYAGDAGVRARMLRRSVPVRLRVLQRPRR